MLDVKHSVLRMVNAYIEFRMLNLSLFVIWISLLFLDNDSCFQTNPQHNYSEKNDVR